MSPGPESVVGIFVAAGRAKLKRAESAHRIDAETTLHYLGAAADAVRGLEAEWDGILAQASALKIRDEDARSKLYERVVLYERGDLLRNLLSGARRGLEMCLNALRRDASSFLRPAGARRRRKAVVELERILPEIVDYLDELGPSPRRRRESNSRTFLSFAGGLSRPTEA
jgi:hypothetical protein